MTTSDAIPGATTAENTARQDGGGVHAEPVPTPQAAYAAPTRSQPPQAAYAAPTRWTASRPRRTRRRPGGPDPARGVCGADTGADGQTLAREQMRVAQGERSASAGREDDDALEQAAALGETSDPADGSVAGG